MGPLILRTAKIVAGVILTLQALVARSASLPLIAVCTASAKVSDEGYTPARFHIQSGKEQLEVKNCSAIDAKWEYGRIRIRGNSSRSFAKKQYLFKFEDAAGEKKKVKLLKLAKSDEIILHAPYVDRSYLRNAFVYRLGRKLSRMRKEDWGAPKTRFVEVTLDDNYLGLFVLTEAIDRGPKRVIIPKLSKKRLKELHYIVEISQWTGHFSTKLGTDFKWVYPSKRKLSKLRQRDTLKALLIENMIKSDLDHFEAALQDDALLHGAKGYKDLVDWPSLIDFFIVQELVKNVDGFRRSHYLYKDSKGKLHWGPLWDFNMALGNLNFFGMHSPKGWAHEHRLIFFRNVFWFRRIVSDQAFRYAVHRRYYELRDSSRPLARETLDAMILQLDDELGFAPEKDQKRWRGTRNFLERHFMNTRQRADTHTGSIAILRTWLHRRLDWLDRQFMTPRWNPQFKD